jgi:hypothetical protein
MKKVLTILQTIFALAVFGGFLVLLPIALISKNPIFLLSAVMCVFLGLPLALLLKKINSPGYKFSINTVGVIALIMMIGFGIIALFQLVSFQKTKTIKEVKLAASQDNVYTGQFTVNDSDITPGKQYDYVLHYSQTVSGTIPQDGTFYVEINSPLGQEKFEKKFTASTPYQSSSSRSYTARHRSLSSANTSLEHYFYLKAGTYSFKVSPNVNSSYLKVSGVTVRLVEIK